MRASNSPVGWLITRACNSTLAELMLPDGAHARSEDWTVFLLKDLATQAVDGDSDPPVTYVLNLVRTKHDDSVRRCVGRESGISTMLILTRTSLPPTEEHS